MDHSILTIHCRPRHPQTQGKEDRFNQTVRRELLKYREFRDWEEARAAFDEFRKYYNSKRPHHALGLDTPEQHYRVSERTYTENVPEWEYPAGTSMRRVKTSGFFAWQGQGYFLSEAFGGRTIAVRESSIEGCISLFYRQFRIGRIDVNKRVFTLKRAYLIEGDPRLADT